MTGEKADPSAQDHATTAFLRRNLARVPGLIERHRRLTAAPLAAGSEASADTALSGELGHEVWDVAQDQLASSLDHLLGWMHLLEAGIQPTFSHLTLVRGSMEASVTARWLLGGVTSSDRVARATAFLWSDYEERRKAEKVLGVTKVPAPAKTAAQRRADLEAQRLADHIPAINLPPFTMLFADHGIPGGDPSEAVYRILSAYAHGRRWRLLMTPASKIGASATGQTLMRVTASDWVSEAMTELAVDWAEKAIEEAEAYIS